MKDFLKNFKLPLILGGCAIVVVAVTIIIVTGGFSGGYGLYITNAYGSVSVTSSDVSEAAVSGDALKEGDVVTIGENSYCTIAYRGKKNSQNNNFTLGSNSQIVISNAFDGKNDGELFLRCGTLIGNFNDDDKSSINVRTADSMISLKKSVAKISYYTNEFMSYTDVYTIMGQNKIQLYDAAGNPFNEPELQAFSQWEQPACGRIIVSDDGPLFDFLNLKLNINELSVFDIKQLLTISALIDEGFPYSTEELRTIYEEKGGDEASTPPPQTETEPPVVTEPTESTSSETIQTAGPIDTTPPPTQTTLPNQTTARPWSQASNSATTATTTQPPVTTTNNEENTDLLQPDDDDPSQSGTMHYVTIIINGEETLQEVAHGGNAIRPADPVIDGLTFTGWDKSFENITQDTVITALFKETSGNATTHIVTVVINGRSNTVVVEHGQSANLPTTLNVDGYIFKGWDKDFTNITQDVTITAILEPQNQAHTVTFVINGQSYPVQVEHGGTAVPPYIPDERSTGFIGWDKSLNNITADTTITAVFSATSNHTVTFMIDGHSYTVTVADGATVEPPFQPSTDSSGKKFVGWDRSLSNITSDTIIMAIFEV